MTTSTIKASNANTESVASTKPTKNRPSATNVPVPTISAVGYHYTTIEEAHQVIRELTVDIAKIDDQLDDLKDLLSNPYLNVDVDNNWIIKAQTARRHKKAALLQAQLWISAQDPDYSSPDRRSTLEHGQVMRMIEAIQEEHQQELAKLRGEVESLRGSLKAYVDKEKQKRQNVQENFDEQRRFIIRCLYEIVRSSPDLLNDSNLNLSSLSWVPAQLKANPLWGLARNIVDGMKGSSS